MCKVQLDSMRMVVASSPPAPPKKPEPVRDPSDSSMDAYNGAQLRGASRDLLFQGTMTPQGAIRNVRVPTLPGSAPAGIENIGRNSVQYRMSTTASVPDIQKFYADGFAAEGLQVRMLQGSGGEILEAAMDFTSRPQTHFLVLRFPGSAFVRSSTLSAP